LGVGVTCPRGLNGAQNSDKMQERAFYLGNVRIRSSLMTIETLTDYMTFQDPPKRLDGTPNVLILTFNLPDDFVKGTKRAKPVLQFKYLAHQDTSMKIYVNLISGGQGTAPQINLNLAATPVTRVYHEFLSGSEFKPGEQNEIRFLLMGSTTDTNNHDVSISDVMLTYQRRINV
jgi:hypothetical protein